jgi:hypothetical protein
MTVFRRCEHLIDEEMLRGETRALSITGERLYSSCLFMGGRSTHRFGCLLDGWLDNTDIRGGGDAEPELSPIANTTWASVHMIGPSEFPSVPSITLTIRR